jgi:hypothetical protein
VAFRRPDQALTLPEQVDQLSRRKGSTGHLSPAVRMPGQRHRLARRHEAVVKGQFTGPEVTTGRSAEARARLPLRWE